MNKKSIVAAVAAVGVAASIFGASAALADPPAATYGTLAGVGSDTTESVMNGIATTYANGHSGSYLISSYDAFNTAVPTITTKASGGACTFARPGGSGNGINKLKASTDAADGCVQFARSSSTPSSSQAGYAQTFVPFATDTISYAVRSDSSISKQLTIANLKSIYDCSNTTSYIPALPTYGSGTRKTFLAALGYSSADQNNSAFAGSPGHACVVDLGAENDGRILTDAKHIIPFSSGSYLGQFNNASPNVLAKAVLGRIGNKVIANLNVAADISRPVFNVIPNGKVADPDYVNAFVGTNGKGISNNSVVCADQTNIQRYGFALNSLCGSTTDYVTP